MEHGGHTETAVPGGVGHHHHPNSGIMYREIATEKQQESELLNQLIM